MQYWKSNAFYFLYYAAAASLFPFIVIYYEGAGLNASQIGFLAGIPPLVGMLSSAPWSAWADVTHKHRLVLVTAMSGAAISALFIAQVSVFAWLVGLAAVFAFFSAPIMSIVDGSTLEMLGERHGQYGKIRLWGAVGWGVSALVIGWLIGKRGINWAFDGYVILMGLGLVVIFLLPIHFERQRDPFWENIKAFLNNRAWLRFLAAAFIGGMTLSAISNFLFLFMQSLGALQSLMGLALTVATISEIPVLLFTDRILRQWNPRGLFALGMGMFAIRSLALSFVTRPEYVLLPQLLHGLTFSTMWVAGVSYANRAAPNGLKATAQGLFSAVFLGVGSAAGAFLAGMLYNNMGAVFMFRAMSLIGLVAFIFLLTREKSYVKI